MIVVLMGVCGSGKTTIGQALSEKLNWSFADADGFHSEENKLKMSAGQPLTDQDRLPWLLNIHSHIKSKLMAGHSAVVTCSALKKYYRKILLYGRALPNDGAAQSHDLSIKPCDISYDLLFPGQDSGCHCHTKESNKNSEMSEQSNTRVDSEKEISEKEPNTGTSESDFKYTDSVIFVLLNGLFSVLEKRLSSRQGHFMPGSLLQSQLDTLEKPDEGENSVIVDVDNSVEEIVNEIIGRLKLKANLER